MSFSKKLAFSAASIALLAAAPAAVYAQQTTSTLRGSVTSETGASLSNASVTIVHLPTASTTTVTSSANGAFSATNLRVGGPYRVIIQAEGYEPAVLENITLAIGSQAPLRVALASGGSTEVITVRGERLDTLTLDTGVGSVFSAADLATQPTVNRDFTDILARDPLVNSMAMAS